MPDIASIGAVLTSIKTATDIARFIKDTDLNLASAETKLKIAELIGALADVKLELAEVQDALRDKDEKIHSLEKELTKQLSLKFDGSIYWAEGDDTPFCTTCYESTNKLIHLTHVNGTRDYDAYQLCNICRRTYE